MDDLTRLRHVLLDSAPDPDTIAVRTAEIHRAILTESPNIDEPDFTGISDFDLERLFDLYDNAFFDGRCREILGRDRITFRVSSRMTRAGGKTTRFSRRDRPEDSFYEIAVSSTLLFQTFSDVERSVVVTGLECRNRLDALQRIFEHEMIHLAELLVWQRSKCSAARFQSMASRLFGHTDHRHELVTPRERASEKFGIRPGSRVKFRFDDAEYVGIVNRITKRATVLVEDLAGERYNDGKRYSKFYVPLRLLEQVASGEGS